MVVNTLVLNKRSPGFLVILLTLTACSQLQLERPSQASYIGFNVEVRNMPSFFNVDRVYVLDEHGAQIGPGGPMPGRNQLQPLQIPESYQGKPVYVCMGHSLLTYTRTMAAIQGGETIVISGEDVNVGLPENLPEIPGFTSSTEVKVADGGGIGGDYTVDSIFVTSFEGLPISTAAYNADTGAWSLVMVDAFDGHKLRFWVKFTVDGDTYYFYNDQVWTQGAFTVIGVTYKGKPVSTRADILALATAAAGDYVLTNSQYFTESWSPIALPVGVILHGGGNVVRNLTFNASQAGMTGFFSTINGHIYDFRLELAQTEMILIQTNNHAGVLAGIAGGTAEIKNVSVTASGAVPNVRWKIRGLGGNSSIGGLCGQISATAMVERCSTNIKVELDVDSLGGNYDVGGIVGRVRDSAQILDAYALGDIIVQGILSVGDIQAGGVAGLSSGAITRTYSTASVLGSGNNSKISAGGLVGVAAQLSHSAALGDRVYAASTFSGSNAVSAGPVVGGSTGNQPGVTDVFYKTGIDVKCAVQNSLGNARTFSSFSDWTNVFEDTDGWMWNDVAGRPKLVWQVNSDDITSGIVNNLPPGLAGLLPGGSFPTGIP